MRVYTGRLDVADDAFTLVADEFRVSARERITFVFHGEDRGGPFSCEGVANWVKAGFYVAPGVRLRSTRPQVVDLYFRDVEEHDDHCVVKASWGQDGFEGSPWPISGELDVAGPDPIG